MSLLPCLTRIARLQNEGIDRLTLQEAATAATEQAPGDPRAQLDTVAKHLHVPKARWTTTPDPAAMPALIHAGESPVDGPPGAGPWGVLRGKNAQGQWICEWWDAGAFQWREQAVGSLVGQAIALIRLRRAFSVGRSPVFQLIQHEVWSQKGMVREALVGGLLINVVALATSFYSMQVYDRVMPTAAMQTLLVLTLGVLGAVAFELLAKVIRTRLYDRLIDQVDQRLARTVYIRFLSIRLDQLPQSVGAMAAQLRGYETVRSFLTAVTTNLLVDAPFALMFTAIIALVAGPVAVVPLVFFVTSIAIGVYFYSRLMALAARANVASNQKTGLLVETVEGAETIKSGQGGWRMLARWMKTTDDARDAELQMRSIGEYSQHITATFQQLSYVIVVAIGAIMVSQGELTFGALIACSILSGRVLAPVAMIPNLLMQWAHTKAALRGLDKLWELQDDHQGHQEPVVLRDLRGQFRFEGVLAQYGGNKALAIDELKIQAGEKIGVLGPVGAGKTTLLRLMSGMYKPEQGRILLDDIELSNVAKPSLAEQVAYVQQDGRLFAGTLRDNLILGQLDPGDDAILDAARATGLLQAVISQCPKGLQHEIFEGGSGLSGGQRQLVNLTRAYLLRPRIWLLDEPTASMDRQLELKVTRALKAALRPQDTLVLVTHKLEMLDLVDRIIVIANHQVVMDASKHQVLARLQATDAAAATAPVRAA